jgi:integrase
VNNGECIDLNKPQIYKALYAVFVRDRSRLAGPFCVPRVSPVHRIIAEHLMKCILTDKLVRSIRHPRSGRVEINDVRSAGLALRVTSAGARTWCYRFRDPKSGKSTRATLGGYPALSLADARDKAVQLRKLVVRGTNPVTAKRQERAESHTKTFAALAERYLREHAHRKKRPRSIAEDERNLRLHILPRWGRRRYDEIAKRDVIALIEEVIAEGKPTAANRVHALISTIFSFAMNVDIVHANPAARIWKRGVERKGTRVLSDDEICLFWERVMCPPVSRPVGHALKLALLTGMRAGEIAGLSRAEIEHLGDAERAAIVIPGERSKSNRAHYVPLSGVAQQVIGETLALIGKDEPYLFPSPVGGAIDPHALAVAMRRMTASLPNVAEGTMTWRVDPPSPHDLRRTCATRLAALGTPNEDVSAVLGHTRQDVTGKHYDMYQRARERRAALNVWASALTSIINPTGTVAVLSMQRKK